MVWRRAVCLAAAACGCCRRSGRWCAVCCSARTREQDRARHADFGDGDDSLYTLSSYGYIGGLLAYYRITDGPLQPGLYRFRVLAGITDRAGNPLLPFSSDFTVAPLDPFTMENRDNDTFATATPLGPVSSAFSGSFTAGPATSTGSSTWGAVTADFNNDNNPDLAVTNNGTNTYFAGTGDDTAHGEPNFAIWNFGFYALNSSTSATYFVDLLWDTDPGLSTDTSLMGHAGSVLQPGATSQDSWNLGMGFIDTGVAVPGIYAPASMLFSPYVNGQYSFALNVHSLAGLSLGGLGMQVQVGSEVPEPATLALLGSGLLGLAAARRRRRGHGRREV